MTMLAQTRSPYLPQRQDIAARASIGTPHLAMIWRSLRFVVGMLLCIVVIAAIMAIKTIAWFPPILH
jgi:hypothetical protein